MTDLDILAAAIEAQSTLTGPWPNRFFCNIVLRGELTVAETIDLKVQIGFEDEEEEVPQLSAFGYTTLDGYYFYNAFADAVTAANTFNETLESETLKFIPFSLDRRIFEDIYA